jgi:hypothetical protein
VDHANDLWHFICDDADGTWTWRRVSASGEFIAASALSFQSFNVCVADAELAGYVSTGSPVRRVRALQTWRVPMSVPSRTP